MKVTRVLSLGGRRGGIAALAVAAASLLISSACSAAGDSGGGRKTYKIVAIAKTLDNPVFQAAEKGAKLRTKQLGDVDLTWTAPTSGDPALEVQLVDSYVQKHVDGLLIDSLGPAVCSAVNRAVQRGIPVVMFDSDCPSSKRLTYVGSDNYKGGYAAGKLYAAHANGKGRQRIDILTGTEGAFNLGQRDKGFKDALKAAGVDFQVAATLACGEDTGKAVSQINSALAGSGNVNGLFIDGPWPLLGSESNLSRMISHAKSGQLTVVAFDSLQPQLKFVQNGSVIGLVGQTYYDWGYQGVNVMRNVLAEKAKYPKEVDTGLDIVTLNGGPGQTSAAEMNRKWSQSDFSATPLPPQSSESK